MKIERNGSPPVIIGKRVTVGAALLGTLTAAGNIWPDLAPLFLNIAAPLTFFAQLIVVNKFGITK